MGWRGRSSRTCGYRRRSGTPLRRPWAWLPRGEIGSWCPRAAVAVGRRRGARADLCLVDDAQWLDVPSVDALVFTARRIVAEGVVICLGCARACFGGLSAGVEQLVVVGLDRESAMSLLSRRRRCGGVGARTVAGRSGRQPSRATGIVERLTDEAAGRTPAVARALPLTGPESVFTQRIRRLGDPTQEALLVAASENTGELQVIASPRRQLESRRTRSNPRCSGIGPEPRSSSLSVIR